MKHHPSNLIKVYQVTSTIKSMLLSFVMVKGCNMSGELPAHDAAPPFLRSYDFERLFTKLKQADLKRVLAWLVDTVFQRHNRPLVRIRKGMSAQWRRGDMPASRNGTADGAKFYTFDCDFVKALINFLIDNAFLMLGDGIYRQIKGIPYGHWPSNVLCQLFSFFL